MADTYEQILKWSRYVHQACYSSTGRSTAARVIMRAKKTRDILITGRVHQGCESSMLADFELTLYLMDGSSECYAFIPDERHEGLTWRRRQTGLNTWAITYQAAQYNPLPNDYLSLRSFVLPPPTPSGDIAEDEPAESDTDYREFERADEPSQIVAPLSPRA